MTYFPVDVEYSEENHNATTGTLAATLSLASMTVTPTTCSLDLNVNPSDGPVIVP